MDHLAKILPLLAPTKIFLGKQDLAADYFFVFLCILFTVQQLCGPQAVRFLAENAASMLEMHYRAFCRLLNIDVMHLTSTCGTLLIRDIRFREDEISFVTLMMWRVFPLPH